ARKLDDRALLRRYVDHHDETAFAALVDRYAPLVLAACRRLLAREQDAEDVLQATFLVLVRKAGSIRKHESVGSWLYGTAYLLARKARASEARRKQRERAVAEAQPAAAPPLTWDGLGSVLDEELQALPDKYRAPLLLCGLQGKTRDEAARELGWAPGAVKIRLERGRELLRSRLARRGIALSVAFLLTSVATAAVPVRTVAGVVERSMCFAAGQPVNAPAAVELATGLLRELARANVRFVAALAAGVLAVGLGIGGFAMLSDRAPPPTVDPAVTATPPAKPAADPDQTPAPEPRPPIIVPPAEAPPKPGATFAAVLRGVEPEPRTVTLRVREVDTAYPLAAGADVRIDGQVASVADLATLGARPRVTVTLTAAGTEVLGLTATGETIPGTLRAVNAGRNTITLLRTTTDAKAAPATWPLPPTSAVTLDGNPATLADLREGLSASVRLSADGKRVLALDAKSP
ncbi:MAG: sigma-70 family RNA polymerase sigma factor, partial [Gemmata sp.]